MGIRFRWTKGDVCIDKVYHRVQLRHLNRAGKRRLISIDKARAEQDLDELLARQKK